MRRAAVDLYCAVVDWLDLLVSTCTTAARETYAVFNQLADSHAHMVGRVKPWFSGRPAA
jgi:hypothetical protein